MAAQQVRYAATALATRRHIAPAQNGTTPACIISAESESRKEEMTGEVATSGEEATMRETYKGYTLVTMSRAFTSKDLFQAIQIKRDGMIVHDCLEGDMANARRFVDGLEGNHCNCQGPSNDTTLCVYCQTRMREVRNEQYTA